MKIIFVVLIGILVYLFLKGLNTFYNYIKKKYSKWTGKFNIIPVIEFISWLVYLFWVNEYLFKSKSYYQYLVISLVIIILIFLSWFVAKDFIAGIVFKVQNDLQTNSNIKIGDIEGRIKSHHLTHLKIVTTSGQVIKFPYSRFNQEIVSEISDSTTVDEFKFQLQTRKTESKQKSEENIRFLVINSPWSNINKSPVIKFLSENETSFTFEVLVHALNNRHMRQIEKSITEQLSDY